MAENEFKFSELRPDVIGVQTDCPHCGLTIRSIVHATIGPVATKRLLRTWVRQRLKEHKCSK